MHETASRQVRPVDNLVRVPLPLLLFLLLYACATPIPKTLNLERPPRLGIVGFKVTAPIKNLSSIVSNPPKNLSSSEETVLVDMTMQDIQKKASAILIDDLKQQQTVEPVPIPVGLFNMQAGERPTLEQLSSARKELNVDAVLYGEIPWYGETRLLYPMLGEGLDITAETLILGFATHWNSAIVFGNIGFELLTSTPLWFGGYYYFGWAFRPVTVKAWAVSTSDGKEIWHETVPVIVSRKELKKFPEKERDKKEIQLEASLRKAMSSVAKSLSK